MSNRTPAFCKAADSVDYGEADIRPEASLTDIICFERPVDAATEIKLVLDAVQRNEKDKYRFKIPAAVWK